MTFDGQMRLGSLEMGAALLAVAVIAARPRVRAATEIGRLQPMRVVLQIRERTGDRAFEGRPPFEVGRGRDLDVVLNDAEVSRRHVRFESANGGVYVEDLKSSNGTFVNGRHIAEPAEVREGDTVDVGTTRMLVKTVQPWT